MKFAILSALPLIMVMLPSAFAAGPSGKTIVSLGTATPGGGFPVYGDAVTATINEIDASLAVRPQNTKGSAENVPLLEEGKLDIALVQGEAALVHRRTLVQAAEMGDFWAWGDEPAQALFDLSLIHI